MELLFTLIFAFLSVIPIIDTGVIHIFNNFIDKSIKKNVFFKFQQKQLKFYLLQNIFSILINIIISLFFVLVILDYYRVLNMNLNNKLKYEDYQVSHMTFLGISIASLIYTFYVMIKICINIAKQKKLKEIKITYDEIENFDLFKYDYKNNINFTIRKKKWIFRENVLNLNMIFSYINNASYIRTKKGFYKYFIIWALNYSSFDTNVKFDNVQDRIIYIFKCFKNILFAQREIDENLFIEIYNKTLEITK
ncbi:hypothetical protein ACJA27_01165 [Mycoplasmopsis lipophila]|uniref:hypothetical protein n=1 Tax=Mycoplasmopsis lipophila TaxID=2117 RepID=UPI0038737798